jgi:lysophospholipase L1-like esterase
MKKIFRALALFISAFLSVAAFAENTAIVPVPGSYPNQTNWMSHHESNLAEAKKDGIDLLFIGDSITAGWFWGQGHGGLNVWPKYYAPRHAANFGIGGDRTEHVLWRIEHGELDGIKPKVVVLLIGTNNKGRNTSSEIVEGIEAIVDEIQVKLPESKVLLLGIFPRGEKSDPFREQIKEINLQLAQLDNGKTVRFLDIGPKFLDPDGTLPKEIAPDLLHVNEKGYQIWAEAMEGTLAEMMK